jgi:Mn2+/Fe2+ NRAMP family transporter
LWLLSLEQIQKKRSIQYIDISIALLALVVVVAVTTIAASPVYAKQQYDEDGFTIFAGKSQEYMSGYVME